ncbi:peptidoglycan DD-metalloendopeptidase family protein [Loktanella sp. SALINAS62]|uniref:peptidoglycan DD-metalloendopeptidase family protein n=1 Tax=Loktanella sp. SALINAS62 TaxID=2706124 RepID=UPI001B8C2DEA|nr:peptidoglycan DD-metalloendopeptidase family protein [Loktanella sp. SALINAS62]MBS1301549.1 peptidoglycan DD-metalloendopeptidase family protein [Loktanella sp. SALINAS62]
MTQIPRTTAVRLTLTCAGFALLAACEGGLPDIDLRDRAGGFDTSPASAALPDRPSPDQRGIITYADYQVAVAQRGDTVGSVASRVGVDAAALASFNGIEQGVTLRDGEVLALPTRVPGAQTTVPLDVTAVATTALDRVDATSGGLAPLPGSTPATTTATQPIRHKVQRGETAFSISRLYNVPVGTLAEWNGLDGSLGVREGQFLLVPQGGMPADPAGGPLVAPGAGSLSPVPPSAAAPLPAVSAPVAAPVAIPPAPDLTTAPPRVEEVAAATPPPPAPATPPVPSAQSDARFVRPVAGSVIRDYNPGKNEGIDIAADAGTTVRAADGGTVAAVTEDTSGTAIVVIKHPDNLLTVYTNLDNLSVAKGDSVAKGGNLGKVSAGNPSFVHFEVRRGLNSVDPNDFLP